METVGLWLDYFFKRFKKRFKIDGMADTADDIFFDALLNNLNMVQVLGLQCYRC